MGNENGGKETKQERGFVQQLAHIGFAGFKDSVSSNFSTITNLKSQADTIKSQLINDGKSAVEVFNRMKNNQKSPAKRLRHWFYSNEDEFGGFDVDDSSDFDPGFAPESSGDTGGSSEGSSQPITADDMNNIAKKQVGEEYRIAAKQADLNIANTAEIVSAINSRSAEMTAAITKVNDTLGTIAKKLDGLTNVVVEAEKAKKATDIMDGYGSISLSGVFDAARHSVIDDKIGTVMMAKDVMAQMLSSPKELARLGFDKLFSIELDALGGKSVSGIASNINTVVENAIQDGLTSLLKNEKFHDFFSIGDFKNKNKDYQSYVKSTYDTKPAVFDGMTRMSIIHIIPEYLKNIEAALTRGTPKEIDDKGQLTTTQKNYFHHNIKSTFNDVDIPHDVRKQIRDKIEPAFGEVSDNEMKDVIKALSLGYVAVMSMGLPYGSNNRIRNNASAILSPEEIQWGSATTNQAANYALRFLLTSTNKKDPDYWASIIQHVVLQLELNTDQRRAFAAQCSARLKRMAENAESFATSHSHKHQATTINISALTSVFDLLYKENHKYESDSAGTPTPISSSQINTNTNTQQPPQPSLQPVVQSQPQPVPIVQSSVGSANGEYTDRDYLGGIFNILNRGINVFVVGQSNKQKHPYKQMSLSPGKHHRSSSSGTNTNTNASNPPANNSGGSISSNDLWNPSQDIIRLINQLSSNNDLIFNLNAMGSNGDGEKEKPKYVDADGVPLSNKEIKRIKAAERKKKKEEDTRTASEKINDNTQGIIDMINEALPANVKDMLKEHGIGRTEEDIEKGIGVGSVLDVVTGSDTYRSGKKKIKEKGSKAKQKAYKKVDEVEEKGHDFFNRMKERFNNFSSERNDILDDTIMGPKYEKMGHEKSKEFVINKANEAGNKALNTANTSTDETSIENARKDQMTMQQISQFLQSAGVNGEYSKEEITSATLLVNSINDPKTKASMRRYLMPMLRKNQAKEGSPLDRIRYKKDDPGPSLLSRIVKYSTLIFKPVTRILGSGLKVLLTISGAVLKLGGSMIKSGAKDIYYGARSLREGIFGSKREGHESEGLLKRTLKAPGRVANAFGEATGFSFSKIASIIETGMAKVVKTIQNGISGVFSGAKNLFDKGVKALITGENSILNRAKASLGNKLSEFNQNHPTLSKIGKGIKNAFGKSPMGDFAKGFFSARNEKKAAKKKAKTESLVSQAPETKEEAELQTANENLSGIKELLTNIFNHITGKSDESQTGESGDDVGHSEPESSTDTSSSDTSTSDNETPTVDTADNSNTNGGSSDSNGSSTPDTASSGSSGGGSSGGSSGSSGSGGSSESSDSSDDGSSGGKKKGLFARAKEKAGNVVGALKGNGKGSLGFDLGKMLGGISSILGGIAKIVLGAITSLKGFQVLINSVTKILSTSLVPLNKAFSQLTKALKPVMNAVSTALKSVAKVVSDIAISIIDVLQPIFEDVVVPIIEVVGPILTKIGDIVGKIIGPLLEVIVGAILAPLLVDVVTVIMPAITLIAEVVQAIAGLAEMIIGGIMWMGGILIQGIANILNIFGAGKTLKKTGESMADNGATMVKTGFDMAKSALASIADIIVSSYKTMLGLEEPPEEEEEEVKEEPKNENIEVPHGSILDGYIGQGDTINTINNTNYYNTSSSSSQSSGNTINNVYGSGDSQKSYGGYLGMSQHGCGPAALADAMSRRSGSNISALSMARAMNDRGTYSSTRGTSVGDFVSTSRALGSNVKVGGVSTKSLNGASPTNPITLLGSGMSFGTKRGNNHYVNVVGGNGRGLSYVSNPLTGRVEGRSTSDLVGHSVLGIYGSGDEEGSGDYYTFPEAVQEAFAKLKDLANNFLKIFTGPSEEESFEAELDEKMAAKKNEQALKEAKKTLGAEKYEKYMEEAKQLAYADYAKNHPKFDGETDESYAAKQESFWQANQSKYLAMTKIWEEASEQGGNVYQNIIQSSDTSIGKMSEYNMSSYDALPVDGSGGIYGIDGTAKMYNFGEIKHPVTKITQPESGESPVMDFFGAMVNDNAYVSNAYSNWYYNRQDPDVNGRGQTYTGDLHAGIDVQWDTGNAGKALYAITDGVVIRNNMTKSCGNNIRWRDSDGYEHIYMHMVDLMPNIKAGDYIKAGELVGHVGDTGASDGEHLHYGVFKNSGWGVEDSINPLTYWKYVPRTLAAGEGKISLPGNVQSMSAWNSYKNKVGVNEFIQDGLKAGMSPAAIATMMSTGIWEDSGKKIFDRYKSLTATTYDYNGQAAFGIMNWMDVGNKAEYGDTIQEQLAYIQRAYFADNPEHERGRALDPYRPDYPWGNPFEQLFGRKPTLAEGEPIGPRLNTDLVEGSSYFFGGALVPGDQFTRPEGFKYVATAADAYNWMIENGYMDASKAPTSSSYTSGKINSAWDASLISTEEPSSYRDIVVNSPWDAELREKYAMTVSAGDAVKIRKNGYYYLDDARTSRSLFADSHTSTIWRVSNIAGGYATISNPYTGQEFTNVPVESLYVQYTGGEANNYFAKIREEQAKVSASESTKTESSSKYPAINIWEGLRERKNEELDAKYDAIDIWGELRKRKEANAELDAKYDSIDLWEIARDNSEQSESDKTTNTYSDNWQRTYGSGDYDISSDIGYSGNFVNEIPPLDSQIFNSMGVNNNANTPYGSVVYNITKSTDANADKRLKQILDHTFEVSSKSIEAKLQSIIDRMDGKKSNNLFDKQNTQTPKLFDERIPSQVSKLSIG